MTLYTTKYNKIVMEQRFVKTIQNLIQYNNYSSAVVV